MINKDLLEIISDFNFWTRDQETGIPRRELKEILKFTDDRDFALIIAGIRRAGKTFLSRQILKEKIDHGVSPEQTLYINFEDPALEPYLNTQSLSDLYQTYRYFLNKNDFAYLLLDEIQNVSGWEKWVRTMIEKKENVKFILTGSSSKFYKSKQAEVLTGRSITHMLFPLSFSDYLKFKKYPIKKFISFETINPFLTEYLEFGGFPLVVLEENKGKKQVYLKELFDDIIVKDIILRYKLRESDIKKLAVILNNQFSTFVSVRKLSNILKEVTLSQISPTSINHYLELFSNSFFFFFIPIFSYKIKEVLRYPKKTYGIDTGILNAISLRFSQNMGNLYENIVARTLWERYGQENIFYWKSKNKEIDFVVKKDLKVFQLIQVSFKIDDRERERALLLKAGEELKCKNFLIISSNVEEDKLKGRKIKILPLWKWLLFPNL
jgi:predicted AAA+ superfamily ATPase